jgi:hypothetical protein
MLRTSVISEIRQRDARTSLDLKKSYLWSSVITCLFAFIVSAMMFDLYAKYTQNNAIGIIFVIISVGLMLFSIFVFILNLIAITKTNFMWMTVGFSGGQCIGRDILDCNPDSLQQFSDTIKQKAFEDKQHFDTAYFATLHPEFRVP